MLELGLVIVDFMNEKEYSFETFCAYCNVYICLLLMVEISFHAVQ